MSVLSYQSNLAELGFTRHPLFVLELRHLEEVGGEVCSGKFVKWQNRIRPDVESVWKQQIQFFNSMAEFPFLYRTLCTSAGYKTLSKLFGALEAEYQALVKLVKFASKDDSLALYYQEFPIHDLKLFDMMLADVEDMKGRVIDRALKISLQHAEFTDTSPDCSMEVLKAGFKDGLKQRKEEIKSRC